MAPIINFSIYNPDEFYSHPVEFYTSCIIDQPIFFNPTDFFKKNGINTPALKRKTCAECLHEFKRGDPIGTIAKCSHVVHTNCFPSGSICSLETFEGRRLIFTKLAVVQQRETDFIKSCLTIIGLLGICIFGSLVTLQSVF